MARDYKREYDLYQVVPSRLRTALSVTPLALH